MRLNFVHGKLPQAYEQCKFYMFYSRRTLKMQGNPKNQKMEYRSYTIKNLTNVPNIGNFV